MAFLAIVPHHAQCQRLRVRGNADDARQGLLGHHQPLLVSKAHFSAKALQRRVDVLAELIGQDTRAADLAVMSAGSQRIRSAVRTAMGTSYVVPVENSPRERQHQGMFHLRFPIW